MITLIQAVVDLDPGRRDAALQGARRHIDAALAQPGCRAYSWCADPHNPARVHVFEHWDSTEALAAHLAGPAYSGMLGHMQGFGITAAVSTKFAVSAMQPVYDPQGRPRADFI